MMELLQNSSISLMGLWVAVSCLSGVVVFLVVKIFDLLFSNQSSTDRYHKSIAGLVFFFLINIGATYYFYDYTSPGVKTTTYLEFESRGQLQEESILTGDQHQGLNIQETKKYSFITSSLIFKSLGIFWLIGALVFSLKMIGGYFYTQSLIRGSQSSIPVKWNRFIQKRSKQLKIKQKVQVFESLKIKYAFTFGFMKPVIALPLGFFTTLPAQQIEAVLLHELYHIKHKDYLINLLTMAFEVIFFYHPVMWWLAKNIRSERENRCDDQVTQITDKQVYAHALLSMESYRQSMTYAIPFSSKQSNLKIRIMRIFEQKPEQNLGLRPFLSLLVVVVFLMGFTFYKLEGPNVESKPKEGSEPNQELLEEQISQEPEKKVVFKSEDSRLGLVLEMTKNTLIAKTEDDGVKLYIDEKLYPLNEFIPFGEEDIATMYQNDEEASHHFFSRQYFESHDREKWDKKNENRNTYVFDRSTEFFTFKPAKGLTSETDYVSNEVMEEMILEAVKKSNSIKKIESKPAKIEEINIAEPVQIQLEDRFGLYGDSSTLKVLKRLVKNFSSDKDGDVVIKIDGQLIAEGTDIQKALGDREIKNVRIVLPSEEAKEGLVEIITADAVEREIQEIPAEDMHETQLLEVPADDKEVTVSVLYETERGDFKGEMKVNVQKESVMDVLGINGPDVLFVIDGKEKKLGYRPSEGDIDPNSIESITVLKDKKATDKYGEKAKNGAIEIYLKKE